MPEATLRDIQTYRKSMSPEAPCSLAQADPVRLAPVAEVVVYRAAADRHALPPAIVSHLGIALASDDWRQCELAIGSSRTSCLAYVQPSLDAGVALAHIARIRERHPHCPVVVVTDPDVDTIRLLCSLGVDEIVWVHEAAYELIPAVRRASSRHVLHSVAATVRSLPGLAPLLRDALLYVATSQEVVSSIKQVAVLMRCSRGTLWHHWTRAARADAPMRLEDYLDWMILIRAVVCKQSGATWGAVARRLGVREQTLARTFRRLAGEKPSPVTSAVSKQVAVQFHQQLIATFSRE